ncbi:MAG TPA: hypothetical protein VFM18_22000 [Methanosarcina sp.]|nr:hypothetical protein [Methanosarcina sp.]
MADFTEDLASPRGAGSQPVAPVQQQVYKQEGVAALNFASTMVDQFAHYKVQADKAEKEVRKNAIIGDFTRTQTTLADALAQGNIDPSRANAIARANFSRFAANNPDLVSDASKVNKDLFEYTNLEDVKTQSDAFKDAKKQMISDATKAGYIINPNAPQDVIDSQLNAFQKTRASEEEFKRLVARRQENRSQSAEDRSAQDYAYKQQSIQLLATIGDSHLDSSFKSVKDIVAEAKRVGTLDALEVAKSKINEMFLGIEKTIVASSTFHPELAKGYQSMFSQIKQNGLDSLDPKISAEASSNRLKEMESNIMLTALANPDAKVSFAMGKIYNGPLPSTYLETQASGKNTIAYLANAFKAGNLGPQVIGDKNTETGAYDLIKSQVGMLEGGKVSKPEEARTQLGNLTNNVLQQVGAAASQGLTPDKLSTAFNFVSSPEYAKLVSYGVINKEAQAAAHKVFSAMYETSVGKAIEQKLSMPFRTVDSNNPVDGKQQSYGSLVDFKWGGSGVQATPVDQGTGKTWLNRTQMQDRDILVSDMKSATISLNQLIRAGAHMNGSTDYQKYWEDNKHLILPSIYPDPVQLKPGQTIDGYKYLGGNYRAQSNWVKVQEASK